MAAQRGVSIIWDESSAEAVAKLRAMNEAGNITWDLVDVEAADAIRLCDEGLAMEIDHDEMLAPGDDGSSADRGLRRLDRIRLLHPADRVLDHRRLPHRHGRRHAADRHLRAVRPRDLSGQARAEQAPARQHGMGAAVRRRRQGRRSTTCSRPRKVRRAPSPSSTRSRTRPIWWSAAAETAAAAGRRRDRHGVDLQRPPVLGHRRAGPADRHALGCPDARLRRLDHPRRPVRRASGRGDGLPSTSRPTPSVWPIRPTTSPTVRPVPRRRRWSASTPTSASRWRRTCRPIRRTPRTSSSPSTTSGPTTATISTPSSRPGWLSNRPSRRLT